MVLADRLTVPDRTAALLLDMDGVLLDTLTMEFELIGALLGERLGEDVSVPRTVVRRAFPYDLALAWRRILAELGLELPEEEIDGLVAAHEHARLTASVPTHEGISAILDAARGAGLALAVVSNNPQADVARILAGAGLGDRFDLLVGNDAPGLPKKPAPDTYLEGARRLGLEPARCVVIEDSLLGAEAGSRAGCHTIAVATGANTFAELSASPHVARCYSDFRPGHVALELGDVTSKALFTGNDFVSHMVEHVAWRLGCSVDVLWTSDDWRQLGVDLGGEVRRLPRVRDSAAALGMIDDGSAVVRLTAADSGRLALEAAPQVDLEWFVGLRVEQLNDGRPLVSLLDGLASASGWDIAVTVASVEDAHHTWEGVFRGVGIALDRSVRAPLDDVPGPYRDANGRPPVQEAAVERGWRVLAASPSLARLQRETAESEVRVEVALGGPAGARCRVDVADSVQVSGVEELLERFASRAGLRVTIEFRATRLSSSHVVLEDIGLALGRALRLLAIERSEAFGIEGAGSNVDRVESLAEQPVRVGVSMEGRKFWRLVPFTEPYDDFRRDFLLGHTLRNGLFSEDLDDFIDGLAGGLQASVMVHVVERVDPDAGWPQVFAALGEAIGELLRPNESRRSLTPGVKATLA